MEREIKFRVINQDGSIIGYEFCNADGWFFTLAKELNEAKRAGIITAPFEQKHIRLQYTGLKDKNGKEIFEGDIIVKSNYIWYDNGALNYVGVVEFIYSQWQVVAHCVNPLKHGISNGINTSLNDEGFEENELSDWEVIGNIYGNPEILNQ